MALTDTAAGMLSFTGMLTCGYHPGEPFGEGDEPPFRFRGRIERVRVLTGGANPDEATEREVFMHRQ